MTVTAVSRSLKIGATATVLDKVGTFTRPSPYRPALPRSLSNEIQGQRDENNACADPKHRASA